METQAMKDEKAMHPRDTEWPKSCREKFVQAWNEKFRLQQCIASSCQVPENQAAIGIPTQQKWARDNKSPSLFLQRTSLEPSENAVYFLTVVPTSQVQHSVPGTFWTTGHCPQKLPSATWQKELDLVGKKVYWGTDAEEEFLHICISDLLLDSPPRKRPRLLPPNRKMHIEVRKTQALQLPLQEHGRSLVPLEYNHLVDTKAMTNLADLPEMESFYRRFTPRPKQEGSCSRASPVHPVVEFLLPARGMEASANQQATRKIATMMHKPPQQLSLKRSAPLSDLMPAIRQPMTSLPFSHLPPKKRYTQYCL